MSWSRRAVLGLVPLGTLALSGCFRPMLAEGTAQSGLRGRIALPPVEGRLGYHLTRRLEARLGSPADPAYRLQVDLTTRQVDLAITQDNTITRRTIIATADWRLLRLGDPGPLISRRQVARSGYNATGSLYATRSAERTVERRLAEELAERIAREIFAGATEIEAQAGQAPSPDPGASGS
ncbi:MAG: LPS assembly lipoprotein LptE [Pikeienuella sp.]